MPTMAFQEHSHQAVESQKSTSLFPFESKREVGGQSDGTYLRVSPIFPLPSCSRAASCVCFASIHNPSSCALGLLGEVTDSAGRRLEDAISRCSIC